MIKAVLDSRGRPNSPERVPTFDAQTLGAIVDEAHRIGLPVTVHWGNVNELPAVLAAHPTHIPGLAANPVVDIDVLLASDDMLPEAIGRLASLGYTHQGGLGVADREAFLAPAYNPPHLPATQQRV